jgi:hypothetical protein
MSTFTLFPTLPIELRLKIWRFTLPGPRNVGIKIRFKDNGFGGWMSRPSTPPPPTALQICHESRAEALKTYILSFGTTAYPPTIYFNYEIDTLCFGDGPHALSLGKEREEGIRASDYLLNLWVGKSNYPGRQSKAILAGTVRFLTLDADESIYGRAYFCWEEIRRFEGLEELLIVTWDEEEKAEHLMAYFKQALDVVRDKNGDWVVPRTEVVNAVSGRKWGSFGPGGEEQV